MVFPQAANGPYPASDPGFACVPIDELLASHAELIARIKLCYGSSREDFEREVFILVRRYAEFVHLLPATADNYFSAPGGLLRLGLETSFFSLQGTDAHIFSGRSTITARRHLEPRWRLATFIAGLCTESHRVLSHLTVTDNTGEAWPSYLQPLFNWLQDRHADRYFLHWQPQAIETRGLGVFALAQVVPPAVLQYLAEGNTVIVPYLMASISGVALYRDRNVLDELVRRSLALVIDRNLVANADRYGAPQFGSHLERYLVDALRRLVSANSAWVPNREKSRVWFGADGLFLVWPNAANDVIEMLEADQLAGIPKAPETMLELLLAAGVFKAQDAEHATWTIRPPGSKITLEAVRLASAAILFSGIETEPVPLDVMLVFKPGPPPSSAPSPSPSPATTVAPVMATAGTQLSLLPPAPPPEAAAPINVAPLPAASATAEPASPSFALQVPMRLNPVVRDALAAILQTLRASSGPAQCCTVAQGIFVPLAQFEQRSVPPALALRALAEVRMLAMADPKSPPTLSREFNGSPTVGLLLDPRFVEGLDLDAFVLSEPLGA